jgi:hypothetical protein
MIRRHAIATAVALAACVAAPAAASASPRYAAPTPKGTADCSSPENACGLTTAIDTASSGDDVYVPGDQGAYTVGFTSLGNPATIHVHGTNGRPQVNFTDSGFGLTTNSTLDNVSLSKTGTGTLLSLTSGATADRTIAKNSGGDHACFLMGGTLRNSVCWTSVPTGSVVETDNSNTFQNDTIATTATDSTVGVEAFGRSGDDPGGTDTFINTIARGGTAGGPGIEANSDGTADITVNLSYSNGTVTTAGSGSPTHTHVGTDATDQTSTPKFVDTSNGNFHELASSATVDSGSPRASCTATDADGNARPDRSETRCDIGAFEFQDPVDHSPPAITISTPADGAHYKQGQKVLASYSCSDPDGASDIALCAGPAPNGGLTDTSTPGAHSFTVQAADKAGNTSEKTVHYTVRTTPSSPPTLRGLPPNQGCVSKRLKLHVSVHPKNLAQAIVFLDGKRVLISKKPTFQVKFAARNLSRGRHKIRVERDYKSGTKRRSTSSFTTCSGGGKSPHIRTQGTPDRGACTAKPFNIVVTVTGAKVSTIVVKLDGKQFARPGKLKFTLMLDTAKIKAGPHRLTIRAADKFKNPSLSITRFVRCQ